MTDAVPILLVDDIPANLVALEGLLRQPGVEILRAGSGREALEVLLAREVALALIDVQMPDMDGFELAELMRGTERTRRVPIIFVTAGAQGTHNVFQGYEAGAVDFIFKPLDPHVLRSKVGVFVQLESKRRELARKVAELEDALRLNDQLTAVIGHDLRSPVTSILLGSQQLLRMHPDDESRRVLDRIRTSSSRVARMITQLLDVARARAHGGLEVRPAAADLGRVCQDIIAETENEHGRGRIELAARGDTQSVVDADRIGQVLANILGNALRHGERSSPVRAELDGTAPDRVRISVTNRGAIPPAVMADIFTPFSRAKRHEDAGLGLGMFIVQELVRAHGGNVSVSCPDGSTSVVVELPRASTTPRVPAPS